MSLKKIISYVDLGNSSRKGVQLTAAIAENHGASVEVVLTAAKMNLYSTAVGGEPVFIPPGLAMTLLSNKQDANDARLAQAVQVIEAENPEGEITTHKLGDSQVDSLIEHARESKADLIVMSCEPAGIFDRVFHRSFAEKLARSSSCPVVVMAADAEVNSNLRNVLVATDYSNCSRRAAFAARDIVGEKGKLNFHHVVPWSELEQSEASFDAEQANLEEWVRQLHFTDVETTCCVSAGAPDAEIARVAKETEADIVVVGSRPHEDWTEKLFGTVTDRLIEVCERPVLAVPHVAVVTQPMSKLDKTLSDSFPASDPTSSWAGPPN
mgnify:CR=1 FL=1|tara:strand:+ start:14586 stop:15557 length:972 start_codon:yes stop_codon:yes gene_type:complete